MYTVCHVTSVHCIWGVDRRSATVNRKYEEKWEKRARIRTPEPTAGGWGQRRDAPITPVADTGKSDTLDGLREGGVPYYDL